jgi:alkylation response protein AidB-like acyl-CoA dehydrogenase
MASYLPNPDQRLLRDEVRRVLVAEHPFQSRRTEADDVWPQAVELGWPLALVPEAAGGMGGLVEASLLAEEFGRALRPEPLDLVAALAHAALTSASASAAGAGFVADVLEGRARPAFSPSGEISAARAGGGWRLSGETDLVWGAAGASEIVILARGSEGLLAARTPVAAEGVAFSTAPGFDGRTAARLKLSNVEAPADQVIAPADDFLETACTAYLVLGSATAIGDMSRAIELAAEYLKTRKQFGVELSTFQALQHQVADAYVELELARSMVALGVETLLEEKDAAARARVASAVKARVGEAALIVAAKAVQLHGGVGVTEEFEVGRHYQRLLAFDLTAGSRAHHLQRFAELGANG